MVQTLWDRDKRKECPICGQKQKWMFLQKFIGASIARYRLSVESISPVSQNARFADKRRSIWHLTCAQFSRRATAVGIALEIWALELGWKSIWANKNRYYIDGHSKVITAKNYEAADIEQVRKILQEHAQENILEPLSVISKTFWQSIVIICSLSSTRLISLSERKLLNILQRI